MDKVIFFIFIVILSPSEPSQLTNLILIEHSAIELHCGTSGGILSGTDTNTTWTKNRTPLPAHVEIKAGVLVISNVTMGDSGLYSCSYQNGDMMKKMTQYITVKRLPVRLKVKVEVLDPAIPHPLLLAVSPYMIHGVISWNDTAAKVDPIYQVKYYEITIAKQYKNGSFGHEEDVLAFPSDNSVQVDFLESNCSYRLKLAACSDHVVGRYVTLTFNTYNVTVLPRPSIGVTSTSQPSAIAIKVTQTTDTEMVRTAPWIYGLATSLTVSFVALTAFVILWTYKVERFGNRRVPHGTHLRIRTDSEASDLADMSTDRQPPSSRWAFTNPVFQDNISCSIDSAANDRAEE